MPTVRNKGARDEYVGNEFIPGGKTMETQAYPDPTNDNLEVVSHLPLWKFGLIQPVDDRSLGALPQRYVVPYNTKNIEIINLSANVLRLWNYKKSEAGNFPVLFIPGSHRVIDAVKHQVIEFELEGTANIGEILVSFYEI